MPLRRNADAAIVIRVLMDQRKGPITVPFLFLSQLLSVKCRAFVAQ